MSSKLSGRRVSMAPNRLRRPKRDPSGLADLDEDGSGQPGRLKNAIYNDEIASLRIRVEDLDKISQEVRSTSSSDPRMSLEPTSSRRVAVRREIPVAQRRPLLRRIVLLRRAAPEDDTATVEDDNVDAEATATVDYDSCWQPRIQPTPPGPRLDSRGNVVPHSLLGKPEEFYRMGLRRGHLHPKDLPPAYRRLAASDDGWEASAAAAGDGADRVLLLVSESGADEDNDRVSGVSTARGCQSAGRGVQQHWMQSRGFALPALENSDEAPMATNSAREHNRRVLAESGFQMRRLTEQLDQCQPASQSQSLTRHLSSAGGSRNSSLSAFSTGGTGAAAAAAGSASAGPQRTARLAGPLYSFIGGWSYQKEVLLG